MILKEFVENLKRELPGLVLRSDVPYAEITTLGVGSRLPFLAEPGSEAELLTLLKLVRANSIPVFILGGGTNLVGMDAPCPMLGIRLAKEGYSAVKRDGKFLVCGAFARLPELARRAAEAGFGGLAPLSGIPGTVGGALRMNAGASGASIGTLVAEVSGVRLDGSTYRESGKEIAWGYRTCSIPDDVIITAARLELPEGDPVAELAAIEAEITNRRRREPRGRSAGCAFRNISDTEPAGRLIDECGLKNFHIGQVRVAEEHANYVVNGGDGSEKEYLDVLAVVRRAVAERHGFFLRPEVRFLNPEAEARVLSAAVAPKVDLLYGGTSSEREISLKSGTAVGRALVNAGFQVAMTDVTECRIYPEMLDADVVYPVLHGGFGEDGRIQKVLEEHKLRFVGSGSDSCKLVMDKIATKEMLGRFRIPTAKWAILTPEKHDFPAELSFPVILKAPNEGSTIGIVKVDSIESWEKALEEEFKLDSRILVEEFIKGVEITVPIVNGRVLPAIEIRSPHGFYDYDAKYVYKDGHTEYFCPVQSLSKEVVECAADYALKFYLGAECRDILRVDFIVGEDHVPYMLEGNALPGCTATSLVPKAARVSGCSFELMTSTLVYAAMKRPQAAEVQEVVPAPVVKRPPANAPSPTLLKACRWMFRVALWLCAVTLVGTGVQAMGHGASGGWILIVDGLFLFCAEFIFQWFNLLEKKVR